MVKHIEHLRPELQTKRFMYREISVDSQVPLRGSEPSQKIPRRVALTKRYACSRIERWIGKRVRIKRFPPRVLRTIKVEGLPGNQIWANQRAETSQSQGGVQVENADRWR